MLYACLLFMLLLFLSNWGQGMSLCGDVLICGREERGGERGEGRERGKGKERKGKKRKEGGGG